MIDGRRYVPGYLDDAAHDALLAAVDAGPWRDFGERRSQIYGYSFHYTKGGSIASRTCHRGRRTSPRVSEERVSCPILPIS